jgi:DcmR-like sensory protein/helix-turn-helix protein
MPPSASAASVANELMTAIDAARILGLSADMVRLLARAGRLRAAAETVRGVRLFRRSDVEALAAERAGVREPHHVAQLYEDPEFLVGAVAEFLAEGMKTGGPLVVIATEARRQAIRTHLAAAGFDVAGACASGQLTMIDARATLERFVVDGLPEAKRFRRHLGAMIDQRSDGRARLRVYGEMVDVLCKDGNVDGAVRFEQLWNQLARARRISRLCTYHIDNFATADRSAAFERICDLHTRVVPMEAYDDGDDAPTRLRQVARLQQRAHALEAELARRKLAEQELEELRSLQAEPGAVP